MIKEELRKLRALNATPAMMEKGKETIEVQEYYCYGHLGKPKKVPKYSILVRIQDMQYTGYHIMKIALFFPEDMEKDIKTPRYEVFVNKEGEEWITRELDEDGKEKRWLTAMVLNLQDLEWNSYPYRYGWKKQGIYMNRDAIWNLSSLTLKKENGNKGLLRLNDWQQEIKDKERLLKEKKECEEWDRIMKRVPKEPPTFQEWMRKDVCRNIFIIYEYRKNGAKHGYCTRCRRDVPIRKPKQDKKTKCPLCGAEAKFKASGKIKTLRTWDYKAELVQRIKGGIVIRNFTQYQTWETWEDRGLYRIKFTEDYRKPRICYQEWKRMLIFEDGTVKRFVYGTYKNKTVRWIPDTSLSFDDTAVLYKKNLWILKKNTVLRQSSFDLWERLPVPLSKYLYLEKDRPVIEKLVKIGMFSMAKKLLGHLYDPNDFDTGETELHKILKIDKARLKRLREMDGDMIALDWFQTEKEMDTIWPDEMIQEFSENKIETYDFNFLYDFTYPKCYRYLVKQSILMDEELEQVLDIWRDYINMAEKMKMNTQTEQIMMPKDLRVAHDRLVLIGEGKGIEKKAREIEKKFPKVNRQLPKLKKFEFEQDDYLIKSPENVEDIVKEGIILGHCVHTCDYYFSRIQTDESYLFFLRKKNRPDMPWYTLEVEPSGNIRQKRTTGDKQNADFQNAVPFLQKWQQFYKKQLTKKEKKLGEKSNMLRMENYKELRKNGNKVWHGPLAGKLLADVLEADFMEVM